MTRKEREQLTEALWFCICRLRATDDYPEAAAEIDYRLVVLLEYVRGRRLEKGRPPKESRKELIQ